MLSVMSVWTGGCPHMTTTQDVIGQSWVIWGAPRPVQSCSLEDPFRPVQTCGPILLMKLCSGHLYQITLVFIDNRNSQSLSILYRINTPVWINESIYPIARADPGLFCQHFPKTAWNWEHFLIVRGRGSPAAYPLDPPLCRTYTLRWINESALPVESTPFHESVSQYIL